jgi:hypothetical protein
MYKVDLYEEQLKGVNKLFVELLLAFCSACSCATFIRQLLNFFILESGNVIYSSHFYGSLFLIKYAMIVLVQSSWPAKDIYFG